jgi:hypothetical protein
MSTSGYGLLKSIDTFPQRGEPIDRVLQDDPGAGRR